MSMCICDICTKFVDTDFELGSFEHPKHDFICESCEEDLAEIEYGQDQWLPSNRPPTACTL